MKQNKRLMTISFILLAAVFVLACNAIAPSAVSATPVPANTLAATSAPLPLSTNTLLPPPTETEIPATPTPAAVGEAVRSDSYEVTVIKAEEIRRVYMGDHYFYPEADHTFVELTVKVSNLTGAKASVPWELIYVIEETGDIFYPYWGGFQAVNSGKKVDGSTVGVNEIVDSKDTVSFQEDAYLRLIWYIVKKDSTTILFGFDNSPNVEITLD